MGTSLSNGKLALGLSDVMLHAGFIPEVGSADRKPFVADLRNFLRSRGVLGRGVR